MMADHCRQGEGHHHQADVSVPAVPEAGLVVSQPELSLSGLELVLDRPTLALDRHQGCDRRAGRARGRGVCPLAVGQAPADQQAERPQTSLFVGATIKIGELAVGPVV